MRITNGQPSRFDRLADSGNRTTRSFCAECGTPLFASSSAGEGRVGVRAPTLDDSSWFKPEANVWLRSAQPWDFTDPAIPSYDESRPVQQSASDA